MTMQHCVHSQAPVGLRRLIIVLCIVMVGSWAASAPSAEAQQRWFESVGAQMHMHSDQPGTGTLQDYSFGLYMRQAYTNWLGGELSGSVGTMSGSDFRARVVPVDYQFHLRFAPKARVSPFLYAGGGLLFHQMVEGPSGTAVGGGEGTSETAPIWPREDGVSQYIPVGLGLAFQLDPRVHVDLKMGYSRSMHISQLSDVEFGRDLWGVTVGLRFDPRAPSPEPADPPVHPPLADTPTEEPSEEEPAPEPAAPSLADAPAHVQVDTLDAQACEYGVQLGPYESYTDALAAAQSAPDGEALRLYDDAVADAYVARTDPVATKDAAMDQQAALGEAADEPAAVVHRCGTVDQTELTPIRFSIQVASFSDAAGADQAAASEEERLDTSLSVHAADGVYRIRTTPYETPADAAAAREKLIAAGAQEDIFMAREDEPPRSTLAVERHLYVHAFDTEEEALELAEEVYADHQQATRLVVDGDRIHLMLPEVAADWTALVELQEEMQAAYPDYTPAPHLADR